jgi:hypothetical protein
VSGSRLRDFVSLAVVVLALVIAPQPALAEDESAAWSVFKQIVFDPTTYAPAITS